LAKILQKRASLGRWRPNRKWKYGGDPIFRLSEQDLHSGAKTNKNKVSPGRDVTLLARRVLPPGELRCAVECYGRQTTTDGSDRY